MANISPIKTMRQVTLKRPNPNPVFQDWLEELLEEAKQKKCKLEHQLTEALTSLSKYPLPLSTGAECRILKGFDSRLCDFLEQRLRTHNSQKAITIPETVKHVNNMQSFGTSSNHTSKIYLGLNKAKSKKDTARLLCYSSILLALKQLEGRGKDNVSSEELLKNALREVPILTRKLISSKISLENCPKFLPIKEFISINHFTESCFLTKRGLMEVQSLHNLFDSQVKNTVSNSTQTESITTIDAYDLTTSKDLQTPENVVTIEMSAGSYDIVLLIDKNETSGSTNKNDKTVAQFKKYPDLKHEYRSLKVGDFAWVAHHKTRVDQELVLPYIVERKRLDDLSASIKDGRFHEQKFRLRRCGLENVIYMVESYASKKHVGLPVQTLMQALANTRIQDGFKVHITDSLSNSATFLAMMTKRLTIECRDKTLKGRNTEPNNGFLMTFEFFNKMSLKNKPLTVTETFIKLLLQLKGLSVEKALAITKVYRTPKSLMQAYDQLDKEDAETLLANLKCGELGRNVGPIVSKSVHQLFSSYDIR